MTSIFLQRLPNAKDQKLKSDYINAYALFASYAKKDLNTFSEWRDMVYSLQYRPFHLVYGHWQNKRNLDVLKILVEAGTDLNMRGQGDTRRDMRNAIPAMSPLQLAAHFSDAAAVDYLLSKGADVNFACGGMTALDYISQKKASDTVSINLELLLIKKGAKSAKQ